MLIIIFSLLMLLLISGCSKKTTEPDPDIIITDDPFEYVHLNNIEWIVLENLGGIKKLLLSKEILSLRDMSYMAFGALWEDSDMREYLNGEFYNSFSDEDKPFISEKFHPSLNYDGEPFIHPTTDKIFLLSVQEIDHYMPITNLPKFYLGRVAQYNGEPKEWWTRTYNMSGNRVVVHFVSHWGIHSPSFYALPDVNTIGVRPAMWIDYPRGNYETIDFGGERWLVLEKDGDKQLIISQHILFTLHYHNSTTTTTWETSDMREFLNGEYYNTFDASSRAQIRTVINENLDNQWHGTDGGNDTEDKIFMLSLREVAKYFGGLDKLYNRPTPTTSYITDEYNEAREATTKEGYSRPWWLRSPGDGSHTASIIMFGPILMYGDHVFQSWGVRPAMWISR